MREAEPVLSVSLSQGEILASAVALFLNGVQSQFFPLPSPYRADKSATCTRQFLSIYRYSREMGLTFCTYFMDNEVSLFTFRTPLNPDEFSVKDSGEGDGVLSDGSSDREGVKTATYQMAVNKLKPASLNPFFSKSSQCYSRQKKN